MIKKATGFTTSDGTFFEKAEDAEYHEAAEDIRDALHQLSIDPTPIIELVESHAKKFKRLIDASQAKTSDIQSAGEGTNSIRQSRSIETDPPNDRQRETGVEALQQQSRSSRKSVSNVGRRKRPEKV